MLTYVINTSENKTFDSDQLFKLVGYNKICWMNYALDEMEKCAEEICEKQTVLGADDFRIAILVDFYGFNRVRNSYGTDGYSPIETGVDLSLYFPFIEAYIVDHLYSNIRKKELVVKEKHIFYIQNGQHDSFNVLSNELKQLEYVLEPDENSVTDVISVPMSKTDIERRIKEEAEREEAEKDITAEEREALLRKYVERKNVLDNVSDYAALTELQDEAISEEQEKIIAQEEAALSGQQNEVYIKVPQKCYSRFNLYCTRSLSLCFKMSDYPYTNRKGLSFEEFYRAFKQRESQYSGIKRYHYYASFGSGAAKAAFDNLSLSLYLIKMYEREECFQQSNEVIIDRIDPDKLKSLLITAWNKVCSARTIALNNSSQYYDLKQFLSATEPTKAECIKEISSANQVQARKKAREMSTEEIYMAICDMAAEDSDKLNQEEKIKLDTYMQGYLSVRDDTKAAIDENEFLAKREECSKISQCPSRSDYENVIAKKNAAIAEVLKSTMNVEYKNKDFSEQKETADKAYGEYSLSKRSLGSSLFIDIAVWVLAMVVMLVPFMAMNSFNFTSVTLLIIMGVVLSGIFLSAFLMRTLPLSAKLKSSKKKLRDCFVACKQQQEAALNNYEYRYKTELVTIEHFRYEIRNITRLYEYNLAKNRNIELHRQMLEVVENKLSAMLNNLGVEPVVVRYNDLSEEFDVNKSYMSNDNRIYKIFSIEAIENLFDIRKEK